MKTPLPYPYNWAVTDTMLAHRVISDTWCFISGHVKCSLLSLFIPMTQQLLHRQLFTFAASITQCENEKLIKRSSNYNLNFFEIKNWTDQINLHMTNMFSQHTVILSSKQSTFLKREVLGMDTPTHRTLKTPQNNQFRNVNITVYLWKKTKPVDIYLWVNQRHYIFQFSPMKSLARLAWARLFEFNAR